MNERRSKAERVAATLRGEAADRPPISFWRHFYRQELTTVGLVEAMLDWQRTYEWDFVKVNPRASYHVEDWGNRYLLSDSDAEPHRLDWFRVGADPAEWRRLEPLKPTEGVLGEHLTALRRIKEAVGPDVPVLMTVFTPLSIAGDLAGGVMRMRQHLENHPAEVEAALEVITEVFTAFAGECLTAGADGLFFATTKWATTESISLETYHRFGRPYDLKVLSAVWSARFNLLHVCGSNNLLLSLLDYPVHAFNWDATDPTNPGLAAVRGRTGKALVGGVTQRLTSDDANREQLLREVSAARRDAGNGGWMLGAGCVLPTSATSDNLLALRRVFGPTRPWRPTTRL